MKKFMFSAVALIAFSFAGVANTKDSKIVIENKFENFTTVGELEIEPGPTDCLKWAFKEVAKIKAALSFEISFETELSLTMDALDACESGQ